MTRDVLNKIGLAEMMSALQVELATTVRDAKGHVIRSEVGLVQVEATVGMTNGASGSTADEDLGGRSEVVALPGADR